MIKATVVFALISAVLACSTTNLSPVEEQKKQTELIERCKKLKKEIDELKGSPIRRNAAIEYFNDQCFMKPEMGNQ